MGSPFAPAGDRTVPETVVVAPFGHDTCLQARFTQELLGRSAKTGGVSSLLPPKERGPECAHPMPTTPTGVRLAKVRRTARKPWCIGHLAGIQPSPDCGEEPVLAAP